MHAALQLCITGPPRTHRNQQISPTAAQAALRAAFNVAGTMAGVLDSENRLLRA